MKKILDDDIIIVLFSPLSLELIFLILAKDEVMKKVLSGVHRNRVVSLGINNDTDVTFLAEVFGEEAVKNGWAREADRLYVLDSALDEKKILQKLSDPPPSSVLDMALPHHPKGEIVSHLFTAADGTVVSWIRHPDAFPEECRAHWRDHVLHFQFVNETIGYEAHHSVHRLALVEAYDGLPRIFAPGGVRWVDYPRREDMISDALDMSIAVSMKIEVVHTPAAGSKIAIRADKSKMPQVLGSLYTALERMGMAITAADLGISTKELDAYAVPVAPTSCVPVGAYRGGMLSAVVTADGVEEGLCAMIATLPGNPPPESVTVSIQGLGEVGYSLASRLLERGVKIVIAEVNQEPIDRFKEEFAKQCISGQAFFLENPEAIYDQPADIFSPCALRSILNEQTLPRFKAAGVKMIGGPANNIFSDQSTGPWLFQNEGILVVPYEGIGAGGVTGVSQAIMTGFLGTCPFDYREKVKVIGAYVAKILRYAHTYDLPAQVISDRILLNSVARRTLFDQAKANAFIEKMAEAFRIGGEYERVFINKWTKNGFFQGSGRFPEGGWRYLTK